MEEAAEVRVAARDAVSDVAPARLRDGLEARVDDGWMAPGVLTLLSARAAADGAADAARERAAAVQVVYEGLSLTRRLVHEEPWAAGAGDRSVSAHEGPAAGDGTAASDGAAVGGRVDADGGTDADVDANLEVVAADVLVARGASLLARTEAADKSVEIIRAFGRDQTERDHSRPPGAERRLEADMFELAVIAGSTVSRSEPPRRLLEWARDLAVGLPAGSLPATASLVDREEVPAVAGRRPAPAGEGGTTSSTDP